MEGGQFCIRCARPLEPVDKAIALFVFGQTVGMRPRLKAPATRVSFCPECAVSLAFGPEPEGAVNVATYQTIRNLIGADQAVTAQAWQVLHRRIVPPQLPAHAGSESRIVLPFGEAVRVAS